MTGVTGVTGVTAGTGAFTVTTVTAGSADAAAADTGAVTAGDTADPALVSDLCAAVRDVDAPDVVFACSRRGRHTIVTGGTGAPSPEAPRESLRYEIGSASKTLTGLLLSVLAQRGELRLADRAAEHLAADPRSHRDLPAHRDLAAHPHLAEVTLLHLITHTSGLPRLPHDLYPRAVTRWRSNPYAGYSRERLVDAFLRSRPRHRPGSRWRYSNFGVALLGPAMAAATGIPYERLLSREVLGPLGLRHTGTEPHGPGQGPGRDAAGHARDGFTVLPPFDTGGFTASGAVRATPEDLLRLLDAHLRPEEVAPQLRDALRAVREPVLRRGLGHRHTHTLTWFRHPTDNGPLYFHMGATMGQQSFLGFHPDSGTALAALSTRRWTRARNLTPAAYGLLMRLAETDGPPQRCVPQRCVP